jgi:hypothetical protein
MLRLAIPIAVAAGAGIGCEEPRESNASGQSGDGAGGTGGTSGTSGAGGASGATSPDANSPLDASGQGGTDAASPTADASTVGDATLADAAEDAAADAGGGPAIPDTLALSGLYAEGSTSELAPGVLPYAPRYELWSDGAAKQRWLLLPEGTQIDTSDMDAWRFPVGTKLWKEFARDGKRLETRLLWKTETGWLRTAYLWNEQESEAVVDRRGAADVRGTTHDVPARSECGECHDGQPDVALGVGAIQLAHSGPGVTLQSLADEGKLSHPPPTTGLPLPDTEAWNALGYLHANCGSCHVPSSIVWDKVNLDLWLRTSELVAYPATQSYLSTVDVALTDTGGGSAQLRIAPGDAAASGLIQRMTQRGDTNAMPPLASELVDEDGVALVSSWIDSLF